MGTTPISDTKRVGTSSKWPAISKLTLRLLLINILALAIIAGGVLYLDQFQRGLMIERSESLQTDVRIFAAALGESVVRRNPTLPEEPIPQQIDSLGATFPTQEFALIIDHRLSQQILQSLQGSRWAKA